MEQEPISNAQLIEQLEAQFSSATSEQQALLTTLVDRFRTSVEAMDKVYQLTSTVDRLQHQVRSLTSEQDTTNQRIITVSDNLSSLNNAVLALQSRSTSNDKLKAERPAKYAGKAQELRDWIFLVEQYFAVKQVSDAQERINFVGTLLEGKALTWFRSKMSRATNYQPAFADWDDFRTEVTSAFQDLERELRLRRKLVAMRQTGAISGYIAAFRSLMVDMEDQAPPEEAAKFHFIEGCLPEVRTQLMIAEPATLEDAMRTAERIGSVMSNSRNKQPRNFPTQSSSKQATGDGPVPMDLGNVQADKSQVVCYYCKKLGHYRSECPERKAKQQQHPPKN